MPSYPYQEISMTAFSPAAADNAGRREIARFILENKKELVGGNEKKSELEIKEETVISFIFQEKFDPSTPTTAWKKLQNLQEQYKKIDFKNVTRETLLSLTQLHLECGNALRSEIEEVVSRLRKDNRDLKEIYWQTLIHDYVSAGQNRLRALTTHVDPKKDRFLALMQGHITQEVAVSKLNDGNNLDVNSLVNKILATQFQQELCSYHQLVENEFLDEKNSQGEIKLWGGFFLANGHRDQPNRRQDRLHAIKHVITGIEQTYLGKFFSRPQNVEITDEQRRALGEAELKKIVDKYSKLGLLQEDYLTHLRPAKTQQLSLSVK